MLFMLRIRAIILSWGWVNYYWPSIKGWLIVQRGAFIRARDKTKVFFFRLFRRRYTVRQKRRNLEKLATYLEKGVFRAKFDMEFFTSPFQNEIDYNQATECGAAGCAAGHGPHAGIPKSKYEVWEEYVARCFIPVRFKTAPYFRKLYYFDGVSRDIFNFIFGSSWKKRNNTPIGAAVRIRYFLQAGVPDKFFSDKRFHVDYQREATERLIARHEDELRKISENNLKAQGRFKESQ